MEDGEGVDRVIGRLALEDGTVLEGEAFGAQGLSVGEVVFNTGMTGYQEVLTDPSYAGQIVLMTYPLIGNYGVNDEDVESFRPHVRGFLVREWCDLPSHWRSRRTLEDYLRAHGIIGLSGIDTRALTRHLRRQGTMRGCLAAWAESGGEPGGGAGAATGGGAGRATGDGAGLPAAPDPARLVELARRWRPAGLVDEVTVREPRVLGAEAAGPHVVVVDYGVKENIVRSLLNLGCRVTVVPARTGADGILALRPDGVLLSNGPGDPADVEGAPETVRALLGRVPVFGICLGHQILALALGGRTFKMKFGHRGVNHPVKELETGRSYITTQNHGYAVDPESLRGTGLEVTHVNLNDGTVEGMRHASLPVFSVQYHPEACPGPEDSMYLFGRFLERMGAPARCGAVAVGNAPAPGAAPGAGEGA